MSVVGIDRIVSPGIRTVIAIASRLAPLTLGRWAGRRFVTPTRRRPLPSLFDAQADIIVLPAPKAVTAYAWGSGPAVLLAHGWEGDHQDLNAFVAPLVDAGYRVVALDWPGHGRSAGSGPAPVTAMARAMQALQRKVGPFRAAIAHSLGGIALALAMGEGLAVGRAAFIATPAHPIDVKTRVARALGLGARAEAAMTAEISRLAGLPIEWVGFANLARHFRLPSLLVHASDDRMVPISDMRALVDAMPDAAVHVGTGLGHKRILSDPTVVARVVDFVRLGERPALADRAA
ncbi:MAG: alpha/beta hydrolase [Alphaproteobacteria bacterium]|nr:alpha/beta hydrolase [Alphaproteobacteria bacterium]